MAVMMEAAPEQEVLELSQRLLAAIDGRDWDAYAELCDPTLTAFEPEALGHLVEGTPFHRFYFDLQPTGVPRQSTISSPHVRVMGDVAVVSYVRLVQTLDAAGQPVTAIADETRVWERRAGVWRHVHFHRSAGS